MEWYQVIDAVRPHVVQISTPRCSGTGFFISSSTVSNLCAVATAAHVVANAQWWEEPIRIFHPESGNSCIVRHDTRAILVEHNMDTAALVFQNTDISFPQAPLALAPEGQFMKVGNDVGWLGFPAIAPAELCFFSGRISAWLQPTKQYLVDGVTINGVSGGPAIGITGDIPLLIGVVSAYIPNLSTGSTLPGLGVIRDVSQFHGILRDMRNLDEAKRQQEPSQAPVDVSPGPMTSTY